MRTQRPDTRRHRRNRVALAWRLAALLWCAWRSADAQALGAAADSDPATAAIHFYQRYISSLRHVHCRFTPSCSEYAAEAIATYGLVEGSARAADRLMRCNASAVGFYPRGRDGRLEDPLVVTSETGAAARVPHWLLTAPQSQRPPLPTDLDSDRRGRVDETVAFARQLAARGDCERASTEYQRLGSLAQSPATDSWGFACIGECYLAASQWSSAERAFLTSGMLAATSAGRAHAIYYAAISRFDAGAYAACERLLADPALTASTRPANAEASTTIAEFSSPQPPVASDRVAALEGLCALGRGDWARASADLDRAAALATEDDAKLRMARLQPFGTQGLTLAHRSPGLAGALSALVPGAGQIYCGRGRDGLRHLLFNGALIWTVVSLARDGRGPAAYVTAGLEMPFYLGNVIGAQSAARQYDRARRLDLLQRAIHETAP